MMGYGNTTTPTLAQATTDLHCIPHLVIAGQHCDHSDISVIRYSVVAGEMAAFTRKTCGSSKDQRARSG
jgi:hypothetical protein